MSSVAAFRRTAFMCLLVFSRSLWADSAPIQTKRTEVLISAAVSLKDVMQSMTPAFEKQHPQVKLSFNFGASGQLKTQIETGAPVDVFVSAAVADVDSLEKKGFIAPNTRQIVARNTLVLVRCRTKGARVSKVEDLTRVDVARIVIGNPATVPAGRYAKEALQSRSVYDKIGGKLILAENVRQVLDYVAAGEVDAGFVYKTDALVEPRVEPVETIPSSQHTPIEYPAALIKNGKHAALAAQFLAFLSSPDGRKVFQQHGFD